MQYFRESVYEQFTQNAGILLSSTKQLRNFTDLTSLFMEQLYSSEANTSYRVKKFSQFNRTLKFTTFFTTARHLSGANARSIKPTLSLQRNNFLYLYLGLPSGYFPHRHHQGKKVPPTYYFSPPVHHMSFVNFVVPPPGHGRSVTDF